jgi:glycosyltransferase involved in cell wall biosynthesis
MQLDRLVFVINNAAFFVSHRLPLAVGSRQAGFEVELITGQPGSAELEFKAAKPLSLARIPHIRTAWRSAGMNPLVELLGLFQLIFYFLRFRPALVHCASPKGVLYGGIAARLCRVPSLVLAISGMGYAFTETSGAGIGRKIIKKIYTVLAAFAFNHRNVHVIVQNQDDKQGLIAAGFIEESKLTLIPGSGVDLKLYVDGWEPKDKKQMVLLPARMLKDKGVLEFVQAAREVKRVEPEWRFVLAGAAGYDNPSSISEADLKHWCQDGSIEWLGHVENMVPLFKEAAVVCLPSYREGMPKALLEAAAAGCAVITTDVTGCREAIEPGVSGDLVPVRDASALAAALLLLIKDNNRRIAYGVEGRKRAVARFSLDAVVAQTLDIYRGLMNEQGR